VRHWTVAGALIRHDDGLVLVANRRRDGSVDWTPPGGVIDEGETVREGLAREVVEETGLRIRSWRRCAYRVEVEAPELAWVLRVEAWEVEAAGTISIDDPDGIVEHVRGVRADEARRLMLASPLWIQVPVGHWLDGCVGCPGPDADLFRFRLHGADRETARAELLP